MTHPHEHPPVVVVPDIDDPTPTCVSAADLLAELPLKSGEWAPACIRRLIAVSTGMVAVGLPPGSARDRLEAAGVLTVVEGADVAEAHRASWARLPRLARLKIGFGSPRPLLVLIGESVNRPGQLPFASRSGTWLLGALRDLGYDELTVYLTNAKAPSGRPRARQLAELHELTDGAPLVALGREAEEVLKGAGLPHLHAPHPSHMRRFKYSEGTVGYARRLLGAGVPQGPWNGLGGDDDKLPIPISVTARDDLPELPPPLDLRTVAYLRGRDSAKVKGRRGSDERKLNDKVREEARRLYVIEGLNCKQIGDRLDVHPDPIRREARGGGWDEERREHHRAITDEAKKRAQDATAKDFADLRRLAPAAAKAGYVQLLGRLRDGDYQASPRDVESLVRSALMLHEAQVGEDTTEDELAQRQSLPELVRRAQEALEALGGGEE